MAQFRAWSWSKSSGFVEATVIGTKILVPNLDQGRAAMGNVCSDGVGGSLNVCADSDLVIEHGPMLQGQGAGVIGCTSIHSLSDSVRHRCLTAADRGPCRRADYVVTSGPSLKPRLGAE